MRIMEEKERIMMKDKPKLFIPVGMPGCGKSTFYEENFMEKNVKYVSRDRIRFNMIDNEQDYFAHENEVYHKYIKTIVASLKSGINVYADATHINHASRAKLVKALRKCGVGEEEYSIIFIFFDVSLYTCIERNNSREGLAKVPEDIIIKMKTNITKPTFEEFSNILDIWTVTV